MLDELRIGTVCSYSDFLASVRERNIGAPKKRAIKASVPFSNITYDFSAINGEVYWEERSLEYIFEITADTPQQLETLKTNFISWVMNVMNEKLYDPFIEGYHFKATYNDISFDDDESMEKTTITVKFIAYPYKIANNPTTISVKVDSSEAYITIVRNNSSHRIVPTFKTDVSFNLTIGNVNYSIGVGTSTEESLFLEVGETSVTVQTSNTTGGTLEITFTEEVF